MWKYSIDIDFVQGNNLDIKTNTYFQGKKLSLDILSQGQNTSILNYFALIKKQNVLKLK